MSKKKEKGAKKNLKVTKTWTIGKSTGELIHRCINEVLKEMGQARKKKMSQKDFDKIYTKVINKHTKIIEKNMGVSYINLNMGTALRTMAKELSSTTKDK